MQSTIRLFIKLTFHSLVLKQGHAPHDVADKNEISLRLQMQSLHIVEMGTLQPELLLRCPLKQTDGAIDSRQYFPVELAQGIAGALYLLLGNLNQLVIVPLEDQQPALLGLVLLRIYRGGP